MRDIRNDKHYSIAQINSQSINKQEYIQVECVPPASMAISLMGGGMVEWGVCLGGGGMPRGCLHREVHTPTVDRQTPVKTFPA